MENLTVKNKNLTALLNIVESPIAKQVAQRYAIYQEPRLYSNNHNYIYDSYLPSIISGKSQYSEHFLYNHRKQMHDNIGFSSTGYTMSDWFAKLFPLQVVPVKYMLQVLGYTQKDINALLTKVKRKKVKLGLIGAGGTTLNFLHWTSKLAELTGKVDIFEEIIIQDEDKFEFHNLLRIPFEVDTLYKVGAVTNFIHLAKQVQVEKVHLKIINEQRWEYFNFNGEKSAYCINSIFIDQNLNRHCYNAKIHVGDTLEDSWSEVCLSDDYVWYGAPDIHTRQMLNKTSSRVVYGLHGNDSCSLSIKPEMNTELQVESYGKINLVTFFMNQLRMTIEFLTFIANDSEDKWDTTGKPFWEFNFKEAQDLGTLNNPQKSFKFVTEHVGRILDI